MPLGHGCFQWVENMKAGGEIQGLNPGAGQANGGACRLRSALKKLWVLRNRGESLQANGLSPWLQISMVAWLLLRRSGAAFRR